jgi:hypothetical protein
MIRLLFLFLTIPTVSLCQTEFEKILTDSTSAVGVVFEDCFVGKSVGTYCINDVDKNLVKGTPIIISGVLNCKKSYSDDIIQYYRIIHNDNTYFIEKEKLKTFDGYYEQIEAMPSEKANAFEKHAIYIAQIMYKGNTKNALDFLDNCKPKGLSVLSWSTYDESEYTEGTSAKIKVYNPTSKTIKYLWFTFIGYNPVDDKIVDRKRGTSSITVKGVGPIKPDESGSYEYTYVWFTDLVATAKVSNIKVQYMDGSIKNITNPKEIMLPQKLYDVIFDNE